MTTFGQTHDLELFRAANIFSPYLEEYVSKVDDDGYEVIQKLVTTRSVSGHCKTYHKSMMTARFLRTDAQFQEQDDLESKLYTNADGSASLFVQERDGLLALVSSFAIYMLLANHPPSSNDTSPTWPPLVSAL